MRGVDGWHLRSTSLTGDTVTGSCSIGYCVLHMLKHRPVAPMKHVFVASADVGAKAAKDSPHVGGGHLRSMSLTGDTVTGACAIG